MLATAASALAITTLWRRAVVARDALAAQNEALVVDGARAELTRDPTAAVAKLAALPSTGGTHAAAVAAIVALARGEGVARDVRRAGDDELRWAEADGSDAFVTAGYDGRAQRWTAAGAQLLWQAPSRTHVVRPSPDGTHFAIGGDDGALRIVDRVGVVIAEAHGLSGVVRFGAWSADGRTFAAGSDHGRVWLWSDGNTRVLEGPTAGIRAIVVGDNAVVTGDDGGELWRWDATTGAAAHATDAAIYKPRDASRVLAVAVDGDTVVSIDQQGALRRWHSDGDALVVDPDELDGPPCRAAALSPNGTIAITGGDDGSITELAGGATHPLGRAAAAVRTVAIASDARWVAGASDDGVIRAWNLTTSRRLVLHGHEQRIRQLVFARRGGSLLSADSGGTARRWELDDVPPTELLGGNAPIVMLAVAEDGNHAATIDDAGELRGWDLATGGSARIASLAGRPAGLAFAGDTIVTATADGSIAWWQPSGVARTAAVAGARALAVGSQGQLAVGANDGSVEVFAIDGRQLRIAAPTGGANGVAFSPDGALLAIGGHDRIAIVRLAEPTAAPTTLGPFPDDTRMLRFSPAGDRLVAAGDDGAVRAWTLDADRIAQLAPHVLADHRAAVVALAFDRDGRDVVSIGRDHRVARVDAVALATGSPVVADGIELAGADAVAVVDALALGGATRGAVHATAAASIASKTVVGTAAGSLVVLAAPAH